MSREPRNSGESATRRSLPHRGRGSPPRATRGRLILVTGGAASGKSQRTLELAGTSGPRAFVATAQALDREMTDRIRRHRDSRGHGWETTEVPVDLVKWFENESPQYQTVVVDCLTLWLSNLLGRGTTEAEIIRMATGLVQTLRRTRARVFVVTNEVGMSLVPMEAAARHFRDLAGSVNQQFAEAADEVHLVVSGVAFRIK